MRDVTHFQNRSIGIFYHQNCTLVDIAGPKERRKGTRQGRRGVILLSTLRNLPLQLHGNAPVTWMSATPGTGRLERETNHSGRAKEPTVGLKCLQTSVLKGVGVIRFVPTPCNISETFKRTRSQRIVSKHGKAGCFLEIVMQSFGYPDS